MTTSMTNVAITTIVDIDAREDTNKIFILFYISNWSLRKQIQIMINLTKVSKREMTRKRQT